MNIEKSDLFTLLSIVLSGYAVVRAEIVGKRQKKLDRQMLKLNEYKLNESAEKNDLKNKADLLAVAIKNSQSWSIIIKNEGQSEARNVWLISDDIESDNCITLRYYEPPFQFINPGGSIGITMILKDRHSPSPVVRLKWDDDFGDGRTKEQVLDLTSL